MAAKKKAAKKGTVSKTEGPCGSVNNRRQCRPAARPCPKTVEALCKEMREYMRCMCEWGFDFTEKFEALKLRVDECCGGPGPNGVPKPPPPPF